MAEVRCPMCGKPNPEELEHSQFCQARLKPLEGRYPAEESRISDGTLPPGESGGEQESIDDWLSFLRQSEDEGEPRPFDEEQLADWMKEDLDIKMPESPESMGTEGTPDWLSSLRKLK